MVDFIKPLETSDYAIEVFNQLTHLLQKHANELANWTSNNQAVLEEIPEDLNLISNTKQVDVERIMRDLHCLD